MLNNLFLFISISVLIGACVPSEKLENADKIVSNEVKGRNQICFNHSLLVLDSTTHAAAGNSRIECDGKQAVWYFE